MTTSSELPVTEHWDPENSIYGIPWCVPDEPAAVAAWVEAAGHQVAVEHWTEPGGSAYWPRQPELTTAATTAPPAATGERD